MNFVLACSSDKPAGATQLYLVKEEGDVILKARHIGFEGGFDNYILKVRPSGTVKMYSGVDEVYGFDMDDNECVTVEYE